MSRAGHLAPQSAAAREGSLDDIGAVLTAIRSLTCGADGLDQEDARAVYSLVCIAIVEWRLPDAATDVPKVKP